MDLRVGSMINGVNLDQLKNTVGAIQSNHDLANFRFHASTQWIEGAHSRTTIQKFYGAGKEDLSRANPFVVESDEPAVLLGTNSAPNGPELVLAGLTSCLAVGFSYNAAARGIQIDEMSLDVEGDVDLCGFLGLDPNERPGYKNVRITCHIKSNAPTSKLQELCDYVQNTSPVMDIVRNPVPVSLTLSS